MKLDLFLLSLAMLLCGAAWPARGSVLYSGIQNLNIPANLDGVYLNFTHASNAAAFRSSVSEPGSWDLNPFFGGASAGNSDTFLPVLVTSAPDSALVNLAYGTLINASSTAAPGFSGSTTHMGAGANQFQSGSQGYIGFKLNPGVNDYFGWMRVTFRDDGGAGTIHDWAWDDSGAGGGIYAGSLSAVPETKGRLPLIAAASLWGAMALRRRRPKIIPADPAEKRSGSST